VHSASTRRFFHQRVQEVISNGNEEKSQEEQGQEAREEDEQGQAARQEAQSREERQEEGRQEKSVEEEGCEEKSGEKEASQEESGEKEKEKGRGEACCVSRSAGGAEAHFSTGGLAVSGSGQPA